MDGRTSRAVWAGAASALVLALVIGAAAGALAPAAPPAAPPETLSAPTPTLDAVITNTTNATHAPSASTPVQAHPQATPSKDKESQ